MEFYKRDNPRGRDAESLQSGAWIPTTTLECTRGVCLTSSKIKWLKCICRLLLSFVETAFRAEVQLRYHVALLVDRSLRSVFRIHSCTTRIIWNEKTDIHTGLKRGGYTSVFSMLLPVVRSVDQGVFYCTALILALPVLPNPIADNISHSLTIQRALCVLLVIFGTQIPQRQEDPVLHKLVVD